MGNREYSENGVIETMRTAFSVGLSAALAGLLVSGCVLFDGTRDTGPDEFGVVSRAPLAQPPDFSLRPPRAGAKRPNEVETREQARRRLFGRTTRTRGAVPERDPNDNRSDGERALLHKADALDVDPTIRDAVARESGIVREDSGFVDSLLFWKSDQKKDAVVDPSNEAERLRRNEALGKDPTDGSTITKKN
ncbi:MAG: hypothetical protein CMM48_09115 [Rhodospirillaceae bacterium]|nr:hypothetical protein [Rhodospirillaceae bacterium]HAA90810.1 DUF3035 domain-containing protein [Rhodospirillaceae bacterium]|tara:strand:+ start:373 stop:948 length:576 start_codon:yes stop_codon:yes gene_type:complete